MQIYDANMHNPTPENNYLLDCNVLMYMFYTNGNYGRNIMGSYSGLITRIINSNASLYITDVLLSEFVNTYIQTEFHRLAKLNGWDHSKKYFKSTFKCSQDYEDLLKEIRYIVERQIFSIAQKKDIKFSKVNLDCLFDDAKSFDFNDRYYGFSLKDEDFYIVTNDADFSSMTDCSIVTVNRALLALSN